MFFPSPKMRVRQGPTVALLHLECTLVIAISKLDQAGVKLSNIRCWKLLYFIFYHLIQTTKPHNLNYPITVHFAERESYIALFPVSCII